MGIQDASTSTLIELEHKTTAQLLQKTQAEVDEIADIMRTNVVKAMERDHKLDDLDKRADALQQAATQFKLRSHKLKRKHWWANAKMKIGFGVIIAIVLIVIIVLGWPKAGATKDSSAASPTPGNS